MSISSSERPFVSGISLSGAHTIVRACSASERADNVQAEDGHAADVDRREHEEELVAEVRLERRRDLGHDEVEQPLRRAGCGEAVVARACGEDISHIHPPVLQIGL